MDKDIISEKIKHNALHTATLEQILIGLVNEYNVFTNRNILGKIQWHEIFRQAGVLESSCNKDNCSVGSFCSNTHVVLRWLMYQLPAAWLLGIILYMNSFTEESLVQFRLYVKFSLDLFLLKMEAPFSPLPFKSLLGSSETQIDFSFFLRVLPRQEE